MDIREKTLAAAEQNALLADLIQRFENEKPNSTLANVLRAGLTLIPLSIFASVVFDYPYEAEVTNLTVAATWVVLVIVAGTLGIFALMLWNGVWSDNLKQTCYYNSVYRDPPLIRAYRRTVWYGLGVALAAAGWWITLIAYAITFSMAWYARHISEECWEIELRRFPPAPQTNRYGFEDITEDNPSPTRQR